MYERSLTIRPSETGCDSRMKISSLLYALQDTADSASAALDVPWRELYKSGFTWFLNRYHLEIERLPSSGESLTIITRHSPSKGLYGLRNFRVLDSEKRTVLSAQSSWLLIDLKRRKPVRLKEHLPDTFFNDTQEIENTIPRLRTVREFEKEIPLRVRWQDMDLNRHVSNAVYFEWALEAIPDGIGDIYDLSDIAIEYRNEATHGEAVLSRSHSVTESGKDLHFFHEIMRKEDGIELARLRSIWQEKDQPCSFRSPG